MQHLIFGSLGAVAGAVVALALMLRRAKRQRDAWAALARLNHETNLSLAQQLYGRRVVEHAIEVANKGGRN